MNLAASRRRFFNRLGGRLTRLRSEYATELPRTEPSGFGEPFHCQRLTKVLPREGKRSLNPIRFRIELQHRRVLRLATGPSVMDDECSGCGARDIMTHITLDKSEGQVDARRHSGGSPDRTIRNKDPIHFDYDLREASLQLVRVGPVRRRAPPVENPRLGQGEGADANGCDAPRACHCFAQKGDGASCGRDDTYCRADHQRVI